MTQKAIKIATTKIIGSSQRGTRGVDTTTTARSSSSMRGAIKGQQRWYTQRSSSSRKSSVSFKTRSASRRSPVVHATADDGYKVAVLGAAGGIGQSLSLLLKMNPMISDLALYDVGAIVKGV